MSSSCHGAYDGAVSAAQVCMNSAESRMKIWKRPSSIILPTHLQSKQAQSNTNTCSRHYLWKTSRVGTFSTTYETNINYPRSTCVLTGCAAAVRGCQRGHGSGWQPCWDSGASRTCGNWERDQVGFLMACQWRNVSVSIELVRWESPLECVSVTAEGVGVSWQRVCVRNFRNTYVLQHKPVACMAYVSVYLWYSVGWFWW